MILRGHCEVCNLDVMRAFEAKLGARYGRAKAGRVVSGLLKAAERAGKVRAVRHCGRVTGYSVVYELTDEQVAAIRAEAIARAAKGE